MLYVLASLAFLVGLVLGTLITRTRVVEVPVLVEPEPPPPPEPSPLLIRARVEVSEAEGCDMSGEAKRHQCYARLIKLFPGETKRAIARAIEDAVSELPE